MDNWNCKPQIPVIDEQKHAAVCPLSNSLRVAGTAEFAGDNKILTEERLDNLIDICVLCFLRRISIERYLKISHGVVFGL